MNTLLLRQRIVYLMLSALTFFPVKAQTTDYAKLSPWVRQVAHASQQHGMRRANGQGALGRQTLTAFVQTTSADAETLLNKYGCRTHAQQGDISIASIPLNRLAALSRETAVRRIEAREPASLTMDTVANCINALPAYTATDSHGAFTGLGVVVGVMDVGFDVKHPNFYTDRQLTETRIRAFWDQLSPDTIDSQLPVGRDFTSQADILLKGGSTDSPIQGHGTHTSGIAAGNGYDTPYRGIAYESDLCLVSNAISGDTIYIDPADYYKYTSATDALGFKYMFDYADSQGKPCVASFSEGYPPYIDEEDSLFCAFLKGLQGPGHIIVASAGNENIARTYAEKKAGTEAAGAFVNCGMEQALYRILCDRPATISFYGYGLGNSNITSSLHVATNDQRLDSILTDTLRLGDEMLEVSLTRYASGFQTDSVCIIMLSASRPINQLPRVALVVEGSESHAEIFGTMNYALTSSAVDSRWNAAQHGHNILAPGSFQSVICVGATAHRNSVVNYQGEELKLNTPTDGLLAHYSSTGPTMDGLTKPDVTAPGNHIVSSYNHLYLQENPTDDHSLIALSDVDDTPYPWTVDTGTSMATPVVAGTIALWLQACPTLTMSDILGIFSRTCRQPDAALSYPNSQYGYGDIDAYRGLLDILGLSGIKAISQQQPRGATIAARDGQLHIRFANRPQRVFTVSVYSTSGTLLFSKRLTAASTDVLLPLPQMAAGVYAVQLTGSHEGINGSQLIRM